MDIQAALDLRYIEMVQIQSMNLETALWMIQFWITATFALIVAFHFAGAQLSRPIAILVHVLYISVATISLATYVQSADTVLYWNAVIDGLAVKNGIINQAQMETAVFWRVVSTWGGGLLMLLGSIATFYYGLHVRRSPE